MWTQKEMQPQVDEKNSLDARKKKSRKQYKIIKGEVKAHKTSPPDPGPDCSTCHILNNNLLCGRMRPSRLHYGQKKQKKQK